MGTDDGEDELELDLLQSGKLEQVSLCDGKASTKGSNGESTDEETDEEADEEKDEEKDEEDSEDSEGEGEPESGEEGSEEEEGDEEEGEDDADSDEELDVEVVDQGPPGEIDDVDPSTSESDDGSDEESNGDAETEGGVEKDEDDEKEKPEKEETNTNPPDAANQHALVAVTEGTTTQAMVLRNSTLIKIVYGWQGLGSLLSIFNDSKCHQTPPRKRKNDIHP